MRVYRLRPIAVPNLDGIPEKMPFSTPYGAPIGAQRAQELIQAAAAEATERGWSLNIAVVESGANLVAFLRMDGALLGSRGGIPLIEDGKIVGAVGCSGGTGSQDEAVCTAAASLINK